MTTATITSPKSGNEYTLYIHNSKAVGCTCKYREFHTFSPCKHMVAHNAPKPVAVVDQFPTLDSCDTCGRLVKKGVVTCARCLGY